MIDKDVCSKKFIWDPSNCGCQCYKFCDFSEYLDYKNCKGKKCLVGKLAEECTENIEETRLAEIISSKNENQRFCTLYIVLFSIIFTANIRIGS